MKKLLVLCGVTLLSLGLSLPVMAQDVEVHEHEDGSVTAVDSEGNVLHEDVDGSTTVIDSEGNAVYVDEDGNTVYMDEDGSTAVFTEE